MSVQRTWRVRPQKVMNDLVAMERQAENVLQRPGAGRAALAQSPPTSQRSKLKFLPFIGELLNDSRGSGSSSIFLFGLARLGRVY